MEYSEKTAWLRRYQDARRRQRVLERELQELRSQAERVTPLLTGAPPGGGDGQALPRAVERLDLARRELEAQIQRCLAARREVAQAIAQVQDPRDHEILHRRYILGQKFEQIAVEMPLEIRWVYRRHKRAVIKLTIKSQ